VKKNSHNLVINYTGELAVFVGNAAAGGMIRGIQALQLPSTHAGRMPVPALRIQIALLRLDSNLANALP
jgi:hypothetical protein